jgi:hypothetical protein
MAGNNKQLQAKKTAKKSTSATKPKTKSTSTTTTKKKKEDEADAEQRKREVANSIAQRLADGSFFKSPISKWNPLPSMISFLCKIINSRTIIQHLN